HNRGKWFPLGQWARSVAGSLRNATPHGRPPRQRGGQALGPFHSKANARTRSRPFSAVDGEGPTSCRLTTSHETEDRLSPHGVIKPTASNRGREQEERCSLERRCGRHISLQSLCLNPDCQRTNSLKRFYPNNMKSRPAAPGPQRALAKS